MESMDAVKMKKKKLYIAPHTKQNLDDRSSANPSMSISYAIKPLNGTTPFQGLHFRTSNLREDLSTAETQYTKHTRWRRATA